VVVAIVVVGYDARISADFWVEGRLESSGFGAEPAYHFGDHMILAYPQTLARNLQWQMPIAEVPGDAQQARAIGRLDLEDRLCRRANPQVPAAIEFETITIRKMMWARQIEQKGFTRIGNQANAAAVPIKIGKRYRVDRRSFRPVAANVDRYRPPHRAFQLPQ
jgi:hypothetical protein